ncbi:MAG: alpha/beta hydrolase [Actinomycetota bacterium]
MSEAGERAAVPVLFLHGIGSSRSTFALQFAHVGRNRWCVAPDAPGYGDSDDNPAIVATDDYGAAIVDLLDQLEVRAADLVGVSWGGVIAARLAATHPERVARLVLADSTRGSAVDPARAAAMRARPGALASDGAAAFSQARSHRLLSPAAPSELVAAVAADMAAAIRLPGYAQAANAMARTDNTELFAMIGCPTLVIVGEHDVVCPPAEAAILTEHIHGASLVTIPDAGHLSNRENPIAFNRALDTFWADHPLAGGVG